MQREWKNEPSKKLLQTKWNGQQLFHHFNAVLVLSSLAWKSLLLSLNVRICGAKMVARYQRKKHNNLLISDVIERFLQDCAIAFHWKSARFWECACHLTQNSAQLCMLSLLFHVKCVNFVDDEMIIETMSLSFHFVCKTLLDSPQFFFHFQFCVQLRFTSVGDNEISQWANNFIRAKGNQVMLKQKKANKIIRAVHWSENTFPFFENWKIEAQKTRKKRRQWHRWVRQKLCQSRVRFYQMHCALDAHTYIQMETTNEIRKRSRWNLCFMFCTRKIIIRFHWIQFLYTMWQLRPWNPLKKLELSYGSNRFSAVHNLYDRISAIACNVELFFFLSYFYLFYFNKKNYFPFFMCTPGELYFVKGK